MRKLVVTLCDEPQLGRAKRTITDIRVRGQYTGPIMLICVDFWPPADFCAYYDVQYIQFPRINTEKVKQFYYENPDLIWDDRRQVDKLTQWEKLHVFDPFFKQWERVLFFDAGTRVFNSLDRFLDLDCTGKVMAFDDTLSGGVKPSGNLFHKKYPADIEDLKQYTAAADLLTSKYFLNSMFYYDTQLLGMFDKAEMIELMNRRVLWTMNEMSVMNAVITFKYKVWEPLPLTTPDGKYLYEWSEANHPGTHWKQYGAVKYSSTLKWDI